jgi:hypothetical protein
MPAVRLAIAGALLAALALGGARPAAAYEFQIDAQTIGQGYQLRWLRPGEEDRLLNRRRFTQTLRLEVWNILEPPFDPAYPEKPRRAPFELYVSTSLRVDHDFGEYQRGQVAYEIGGVAEEDLAVDAVPELDEMHRQLDVLWAYVGGRDLWGRVDFKLGRQLEVDALDWFAFDGLTLRVRLPWRTTVEARGGLMVRSASLWGSPAHELDGTSGADCTRVEAGGSTWIPTDECAQRQALMPTVGLALEQDLGFAWARVAYRRAQSRTSDDFPGDAPAWGVNEELVTVTGTARRWGGRLVLDGGYRHDLALAQTDDAYGRVTVRLGDHALRAETAFVAPHFDADSIFVVFAAEPYTDFRLGWDLWPGRGSWRGWARGFTRVFDTGEGVEDDSLADVAFGGSAGLAWRGRRGRARLELTHEDGWGGRKTGGDLSGTWRTRRGTLFEGRVTLLDFADDERSSLAATTFAAQGGVRFVLADGIALHVLGEENVNRWGHSFRLIGVLDLAFQPEI